MQKKLGRSVLPTAGGSLSIGQENSGTSVLALTSARHKTLVFALLVGLVLAASFMLMPAKAHAATVNAFPVGSSSDKIQCQSGDGAQQYYFSLSKSSNLTITIEHPVTKTDDNFLSVRLTDGANYLTQVDTVNIKGNGSVNGYLAVPAAFSTSKIVYTNIPAGGPYFIEVTTNTRIPSSIFDQYINNIGFSKNSYYKISTTKVLSLSKASISMGAAKAYTGKTIKARPTVTLYDKKLVLNRDYKITSYKKNKSIGRASVTIKGIGKYSGTRTVTFKIVPKKVVLNKPVAGDNKITVKWKRTSGVTGYQIRYCSGYQVFDFFQLKNVTRWNDWSKPVWASPKAVSKALKLSDKTKYKVQVRGYKTAGSAKYYGAWSSARALTTK